MEGLDSGDALNAKGLASIDPRITAIISGYLRDWASLGPQMEAMNYFTAVCRKFKFIEGKRKEEEKYKKKTRVLLDFRIGSNLYLLLVSFFFSFFLLEGSRSSLEPIWDLHGPGQHGRAEHAKAGRHRPGTPRRSPDKNKRN